MRSIDILFAASSFTAFCCACLHALLKGVFRSECIDGYFGPSGSILRPILISCIVAAVLSLLASATFGFKSQSRGAWAIAAAICSKWQPVYFTALSVQRVILRAILIPYTVGNGNVRFLALTCPLKAVPVYETQIHASTFIWDCVILLMGMLTLLTDKDANFTPTIRRCAYIFLVFCLLLDGIGSYIWGNTMAFQVSVPVGSFNLFLDNLITSCVTSQAIISLHFAFVSFRSRNGRGWSYASLKFEFEPLPLNSTPAPAPAAFVSEPSALVAKTSNSKRSSAAFLTSSLLESECESDVRTGSRNAKMTRSSIFFRLPRRLQEFQENQLSKCRTFLVPRVADAYAFAITRPVLDLKCFRLLQRLADAHPKFYFSFVFCFFTLTSFLCEILLPDLYRDISVLCLDSFSFTILLGYWSSRRHGLDRVAVRHVASSFRFAALFVLWMVYITVNATAVLVDPNQVSLSEIAVAKVFLQIAVGAVQTLLFLGCALMDCCPHTSTVIQIFIMVKASHSLCSFACRFYFHVSRRWVGV